MPSNNCINKTLFDALFRDHSIKIAVTLKSSITAGDNFDPFRNTGEVRVKQNPVWINAMTKAIVANSLIYRQMGLTETGALQIIVESSDTNFIKLSENIVINNQEYYIYSEAVGNRLQITPLEFGYDKIVIFLKDI